MFVTVAICTWNRSTLLDQTLSELCNLRIPSGIEWELLVVNNNCTDETDDTITKYGGRLPIRRLFEPKPGLSNARNCAVDNARGEYILWTDDDVLVPPNWLGAYVAAFEAHPEAAIFGGDIEPWFEGEPAPWLLANWDRVKVAYAVRDFGNTTAPIDRLRIPFGANFAVRMSEMREYRFDAALGPIESQKMGGDETTVMLQMLATGIQGYWVVDAAVRHYIPRDRQTIVYLRRFFYGQGQTTMLAEAPNDLPSLFGKPRYAWKMAFASELIYRWYRLLGQTGRSVPHLARASEAWGVLLTPGRQPG